MSREVDPWRGLGIDRKERAASIDYAVQGIVSDISKGDPSDFFFQFLNP